MTENATIFIPDISGYTEFLSRTELEHSAHIINELMELLVDANTSDCVLAEVEGDALLFYRKGEAISWGALISQCINMFRIFHTRLKLIERDSIPEIEVRPISISIFPPGPDASAALRSTFDSARCSAS
jgi:hypothetical protein